MSDKSIHTSMVRDEFAYTRGNTPWIVETYGKKLFRYLSGGGLGSLGRTVLQEEKDARARRFLTISAVIGVIWLVLLVV